MVAVYDASLQAAIGLRLGRCNFVELMGVELVRNRRSLNPFQAEKFIYQCHLERRELFVYQLSNLLLMDTTQLLVQIWQTSRFI